MSSEEDKKHQFGHLPIEIVVSVGVAKPALQDLLKIDQETIFPLDRGLDGPVDLLIGGKLVATGVLEEITEEDEQTLSVRVTSVLKTT